MPDGRPVHAALMACSPCELHWASSVEDPDRCDSDKAEGICAFCHIRDGGDAIFTKVTGCYRSSNRAVRASNNGQTTPTAHRSPHGGNVPGRP